MTRSGQKHAEWDLCMYLQSPITPILPGVIQQAVQFHSCHHNVVIWIIETGTHQNTFPPFYSRPLVLLLQMLIIIIIIFWLLFFFCVCVCSERHHGDNKDITMHARPPRCVQWAWPKYWGSIGRQRDGGETWKAKLLVRGRLSWQSSSPLSIARQPLSQVQECIMERARDEERVPAERGKVNKVHWSGSECWWTTPDLSPSYPPHYRTIHMWRRVWGPQRCLFWTLILLLHHNFSANWLALVC